MRLVTFRVGSHEGVGRLADDGATVVDLTAAGAAATMLELIAACPGVPEGLAGLPDGPAIPVGNLALLAPIPVPRRNIFCVGKNYREHAAEFGRSGFDSGLTAGSEVPDAPIIFTKPPSSVIGPGAAIDSALDPYGSVGYEAELTVVIGRAGRVEPHQDPMSFVFGYTILNDVTSRELQKQHKQWLLGKGIDTFAPMGPAIITADEVPDPTSLQIRLWVNGELRQSAVLRDLVFDIPSLIRTIGRSITLQPGDIIATGTPVGVGIGFKPPRYLRPGDTVRIEVPEIGVLENTVA